MKSSVCIHPTDQFTFYISLSQIVGSKDKNRKGVAKLRGAVCGVTNLRGAGG